ncbi:MAG TPA: hypothetical protein VNQ73_01250 [Ilumatobacter sp.]|nr:hypothetical protein [Ilumatobacter sp.]
MATLEDQLTRLAERGPVVDPRFVVRRAIQIAANDDDDVLGEARTRRDAPARHSRMLATPRPRRRSRSRLLSTAAATVLIVAGVAGVFYLRSGLESPAGDGTASAPPIESDPGRAVDPTNGPLLATPVPADVQPLVSVDRPGWTIAAFSGFQPVTAQRPSTECPGCGATRLILAADGAPVGGALFTAWTLGADHDPDQLDTPVTVGTIPGRAASRASGTPTAQNRMTIAWPVGPGRTAFVDASGLSNAQVIEMAAALTFESEVPAMPARPPGFHLVEPPTPGTVVEVVLNVTDGPRSIELYATNGGLHGLIDWRNPSGHLMFRELQPRVVDGVTVVVDQPPAGEQPIVALDADWIAGGWGYKAVGHMFDSQDEFLEVLGDLRLTDHATFSAATAGLTPFTIEGVTPTAWQSETAGS